MVAQTRVEKARTFSGKVGKLVSFDFNIKNQAKTIPERKIID